MPAKSDCSSLVDSNAFSSTFSNAFSSSFLHRVQRLPEPSAGPPALLASPWDVEPVAAGRQRFHAVVRRDEPIAEGVRPWG